MTDDDLRSELESLISLPHETEWVEFKRNNINPDDIGEYISALSNSAALHRKESGYIVWGVADEPSHSIVGTTFKPRREKIKGQELENWLSGNLFPKANFQIQEFEVSGKAVVLFCIQPAPGSPVRFRETEWIRIGSYKKKLRDHPDKERALWAILSQVPFERGTAAPNANSEKVFDLIDYPKAFQMLKQSLPDNRAAILERLCSERVLVKKGADRYDISNLGAIMFAKRLASFDRLSRKATRIIIYGGIDRTKPKSERLGGRGYAVGFEGAIRYINEQLPRNEQVGEALRQEVRMYPEIAIRELVANALIHQDFNMTGTGPMVEIFSDRIEITNPGRPLIDPLRFIDEPPQSRNESLASTMRRMNVCEERGSGIDKVVSAVEAFQLPPPDFEVTQDHTKATLFSFRTLAQMNQKERVCACYQHACLCYVSNRQMTNDSIRKRFAITEKNYPMASRIIRDSIDMGLIKSYDPENKSKRHAKYVPFWS